MSAEPLPDQPARAELSTGQRIRSREDEGYLVLPATLDAETEAPSGFSLRRYLRLPRR